MLVIQKCKHLCYIAICTKYEEAVKRNSATPVSFTSAPRKVVPLVKSQVWRRTGLEVYG